MEKIKLEIAGIPAVLYGKRSRRVYLYVHGKNGSAARLPALPAQLARQAGRYWLSICRSTATGKTARKSWCRGWSPGNCRRSMPGCIRYGSISGCMGSASGRGLLCRRCRRKNRRRRCWMSRSWIWKIDPCPDAAGRGNGGAAARGRGDPHRLWGDAFVAVSVLGAGAPAALESTHTGALC